MLPTPLLLHRFSGDELVPRRLPLRPRTEAMAQALIDLFGDLVGRTQGEVDEALKAMEGSGTDYRVRRGLAHLLQRHFSTFEVVAPQAPEALRERLFLAAAEEAPSVAHSQQILARVAEVVSVEAGREVTGDELREALYADLNKNKKLVDFEPPSAETLIHRYNLSQVQGVFYRATEIVIHAFRNDPGEYKLLFRYLKLFQLLALIEGDADQGFTLTIDGPASIFKQTTRYGNQLAMMLPALLHVTKWRLEATLQHYAIDDVSGHFHDTYGQALSNTLAFMELGVWQFDTSISGLGGCPYAKGATGNVATEDVVYMLHGMGIETGIDMDKLLDAGMFINEFLQRKSGSRAARALLSKRES